MWSSARPPSDPHPHAGESMRNLNSRLAVYLDKVRELESSNRALESRITALITERREATAGGGEHSAREEPAAALREEMKELIMENAHLMLMIDNARLAADDFKVKFETEHAMRQGVEQDVANLRKLIDDTNMSRLQLESQLESLKEELILLKKEHEEDVSNIKSQITGSSVEVQMEAQRGQDLSEIMNNIRKQYENAAKKNQEETETWYKAKFEAIAAEVSESTEGIQQGRGEVQELRRHRQALEIDLQAGHSMNHSLEDTLNETMGRYAREMTHYNATVRQLEAEVADVHAQVARQGAEYEALLNIKTKLEEEIATYHHLLEATGVAGDGIGGTSINEGGIAIGGGAREDVRVKGAGAHDDISITGPGAPDAVIIKGPGAHDDISFKGAGTPEDTNFSVSENNPANGLPDDESLEFSLEQALSAAPPCPIPDTLPENADDIGEEKMVCCTEKKIEMVCLTVENKGESVQEERREEEEAEVIQDEPPKRIPEENIEEEVKKKQEEVEQEVEEYVKVETEVLQAPPCSIDCTVIRDEKVVVTEIITVSLTAENEKEQSGERREEEEEAEVIQEELPKSIAVEVKVKEEVEEVEEEPQKLEIEMLVDGQE